LPWRRTRDPYAIWVSEIMLQQTTVEVVEKRWTRFMRHFPRVEALARAPEQAVLAEWSGLGYYARACNLHRGARAIAARGAFPRTVEGWRDLPGVGAYTSAAVASIAFGVRAAVVDGNVVRVLCRLLGLRLDPKAPRSIARLRQVAQALVPARGAGDHNQALMELGALVCTPHAPRCGACPLRGACRAAASGKPEGFPRAPKRLESKSIHLVAGIVERGKRILLVEDRTLVKGHLCVPMFEVGAGQRPANVLRRGWEGVARRKALALEPVTTLRHAVLDRRYLVSLFTFKEKSPAPSRSRQPVADGPSSRALVPPVPPARIFLLSPRQIPRHAHGGLLLKVLAAWRERRS
jgi:A/G-specific adenine glycosylase